MLAWYYEIGCVIWVPGMFFLILKENFNTFHSIKAGKIYKTFFGGYLFDDKIQQQWFMSFIYPNGLLN